MTLSEIKQILEAHNIRLTKSLGQSFLHDANQVRRILAAADLKRSDRVLEIGPGLGPLTELLVQTVREILAIEKDARLLNLLSQRLSAKLHDGAEFTLIHDDALEYLRREPRDWEGWKLVANLPYSVASSILVEFVLGGRGPRRLVVTLQNEVAKRLLAKAAEEEYGLLTLLVQLDYTCRAAFKIPASCFYPEPKVDSACVCLTRRDRPLLSPKPRESYIRIIKRGFSQRRKMMLKLLKEDWPAPDLEQAFEQVGLSRQCRAEGVTLEQFVRLSQVLAADCPHG